MAPLPKLVWFREQEPKLFERVAFWVGIKDFVLPRLCDALVTDHSLASGTGLMDIQTLAWDSEALQLAGITARATAGTGPHDDRAARADRRRPPTATGLPAGTPVVVGAGDGPLANLGLGAVEPGVAACSIGTSGALRVMVEKPGRRPARRGLLLRADRASLGGRRRHQQRRHRARLGRPTRSRRTSATTRPSGCSTSPAGRRPAPAA